MIDHFPQFAKIVQKTFEKITKDNTSVFVTDVDVDALYEAYLGAFPEGTNPTGLLAALDDIKLSTTLPEHEQLALRVLMQQRRAEIAGGTWEAGDEREALAGQWIRNEVGG